MAQLQRIRRLRHRVLDGLSRGTAARSRLRKLDAWLSRIAGTLNTTAAAISVTFANATNIFTAAAHGLSQEQAVQVAGVAIPTGFSAATDYYVIWLSANTFSLASSPGNAELGVAIEGSDDGTTVTVTAEEDSEAVIQLLRSGANVNVLHAATDIDSL